jgi:large subunit ribosomal protein L4
MPKHSAELAPVKVPLYSATHEKVGELEVAGGVFGREGDLSLLHEAVRMQLANRRAGTASTKTKG